MKKVVILCGWRDWLYKIHMVTGLAAAVWLLLIAVTGVLINHQESLGLLDAEISDRYLPGSYRADARTGATRLNVIVTDLHSGRIFGVHGHWISDLIALLPVVSLTSGAFSYRIKRKLQKANHRQDSFAVSSPSANGNEQRDVLVSVTGAVPENSGEPSRSRVSSL